MPPDVLAKLLANKPPHMLSRASRWRVWRTSRKRRFYTRSIAATGDGEERGRADVAVEDRLSALPDDVLRVVLSCLTSKQAARTTLLSRRWRHLWRDVPCIDIDQREFFRPPPPRPRPAASWINAFYGWIPEEEEEEEERRGAPVPVASPWKRFQDAADWLSLRQHYGSPPPLDALRLRVGCGDFDAAGRWIDRGLVRRPAAFHLRVDNGDDADDPDGWPWFWFPDAASTSRLTTLRLSGMSLTRDFADAVAANFPEPLHRIPRPRRHVDKLRLTTPGLVSLRVLGHGAPPVSILDHEALAPPVAEAALARRAGDLGVLRHLRGATTLRLSRFSTEALLDDGERFPLFRNLRTLVLDECDVGADCHVLRRFLRNAPFLETLAVRNCLRNSPFYGGGAPVYRKSRKRKERAKRKRSDEQPAPPACYPCWNLKMVELEFSEDNALCELSSALRDITKEVVHPIEGSVQDGRRTVKIKYT
ncbi:unnamed protein product [Urochloa decumbens]|uniref:F-box domain-containing protein n=1 Tax=Urochloa decumbens TaxID=240449 RepID=A0ABC9CX81_9POAL